jgi:chromate reductase, NAD(P)H dehydrogenase (quinone)
MSSPIRVLGISGSLRKASLNTQLLRAASKVMPEHGMTLEIFDLSPLPMYNSDIHEQGFPASVEELRIRIARADALLITTPEYNGSVTGALKNALDWASRAPMNAAPGTPSPISRKPMAMASVGGRFGGLRSQIHLRQIADHMNLQTVKKPEVFVSNAPTKAFDHEGDLVDLNTIKFLKDLLAELAALTRQSQRSEKAAVQIVT